MNIIHSWKHSTPLTCALSAMISMLDNSANDVDKALARMFLTYGDKMQDEMLGFFHQADQDEALSLFYSSFRKYDMTGDGHIDMALWHLVNHKSPDSVLEQAFLAGFKIEQEGLANV